MSALPPVPALAAVDAVAISIAVEAVDAANVDALGFAVYTEGDVPAELGLDREALKRAGFEAKAGSTLVLPQADGPDLVAVGAGVEAEVDATALRDLAAAFTRATTRRARIALRVGSIGSADAAAAVRALTEGALLARYAYTALKSAPKHVGLEAVTFVLDGVDAAGSAEADEAIIAARISARAAVIARDLANTPPDRLTATGMGDIAVVLGERFGFGVELFDKAALTELGCGGLLGVNQGSAEEPRMIKLTYRPTGESAGHLGLVGKGIMYDSGGISLKPSDHAFGHGLQAGRRARCAQRHHCRGQEHRRRGTPGDDGCHRTRERRRRRRNHRHRNPHRRRSDVARTVDRTCARQ